MPTKELFNGEVEKREGTVTIVNGEIPFVSFARDNAPPNTFSVIKGAEWQWPLHWVYILNILIWWGCTITSTVLCTIGHWLPAQSTRLQREYIQCRYSTQIQNRWNCFQGWRGFRGFCTWPRERSVSNSGAIVRIHTSYKQWSQGCPLAGSG